MKPDGSIVCEVVEEIDDPVPSPITSRCNTSLLGGERVVKLELGEEANETDPLLPAEHFNGPVPVKVEVKTEFVIKTEDGEEPIFHELTNPYLESKFKNENCINFDNIEGLSDEDIPNIPVIDISEIDSKPLTHRAPLPNKLPPIFPLNHSPGKRSDRGLGRENVPPVLSDVIDTSSHSPLHDSNGEQQPENVDWGTRSSEPVVINVPNDAENCPCIIETLLELPFVHRDWTTEERKAIVVKGKPTEFPVRLVSKAISRDKFDWLTGCSARQELYCWPCLLFQPKLVWSSTRSLLSDDALYHSIKLSHKKSVAMLEKFEEHFKKLGLAKKIEKPVITTIPKPVPEPTKTKPQLMQSNNSKNYCLVSKLIHNDVRNLPKGDRDKLIMNGRPRPSLGELALLNSSQSSDIEYDKVDWLTASRKLRRLFCWPCLMLPQNLKIGVWTKFGFCDFRQLNDAVGRHAATQVHIDAYLQLKVWESEISKKSIRPSTLNNQNTRKQRDFLKYIVDVSCFMKQKINNTTISIEDYVDVLKLVSSRDEKLKYFFQENSVKSNKDVETLITPYLKSISTTLQSMILSRIKDELKKTMFVSLILNDTGVHDKLRSTYVAAIVRYTSQTGEPRERFVKFIKASTDRSVSNFLKDIYALILELDCAKKIVGFTYDGGVVQPSTMLSFNNSMKDLFPSSNFFHYRDHRLRSLIIQSLSHIKCSKDFIFTLKEISTFFENAPNAKDSFLMLVNRKKPINWDISSGLVFTITNHYCPLITFFESIKSGGLKFEWTNKIMAQADKFVQFLLRLKNRFLVVLLSKIFSDVDHLCRVIEGKFDSKSRMAGGKNAVDQIKTNLFEDIFKIACSISSSEPRVVVPGNLDIFKDIYQQVTHDVSTLLKERTSDLEKWEFFNFVPNDKSFGMYLECAKARLSTVSLPLPVCGSMDCQRLLPQLVFIRSNERLFGDKDIDGLVRCLHSFDMIEVVDELYKFLMFIRTIPMIANDPKRPKIAKINDYVKGKKELDDSDTLMFIEKELLSKMQSDMNFYDDVIDVVIPLTKRDV
ncbi:hypothetical protein GE061_012362 [Apolygus lucorum]|uniref:DUF4371 domain-containing protein n=1 Tax=Apolygus lucorum TaxID=248454 RepID=A0A8S9XUT0_APOLU|nr:hypothetical protein GE061_012362 [Apolygus lucorum]